MMGNVFRGGTGIGSIAAALAGCAAVWEIRCYDPPPALIGLNGRSNRVPPPMSQKKRRKLARQGR